jgi:predicted RNase H-like HicB family nuclease
MVTAKGLEMSPKQILEGPYHRIVVPDGDGFFSAEISEFPGCVAVGTSAVEALTNLEEVAESWLESAIANGQAIPNPEEEPDYSGKLVLRLPKSLHATVSHAASKDGVSLNAYLCTAIAHYVGFSEASRMPTNVVNLMTGPSYVSATNMQQNVFVGTTANVSGYSQLTLAHPVSGTLTKSDSNWGRRANG